VFPKRLLQSGDRLKAIVTRVCLFFLIPILLSFSVAQDLTEARELVEHVRQSMTPQDIQTVEVKISRTHFRNNESDQIEQFYDLRNQRVITFVYDGNGRKLSESIFENNYMKTRMTVSGELTEENVKQMTSDSTQIVTEYLTQLKEFRVFIPRSYEILSYDGMVDYGNNIKGEQVTLAYYDSRKNNNYTVVHWIFSNTGELIASIFPGPPTYIAVHEVFGFAKYLRVKIKVFVLEDGTAYPFSEIREEYYYDRDINETQFVNFNLE
jgi:hypothetical protein